MNPDMEEQTKYSKQGRGFCLRTDQKRKKTVKSGKRKCGQGCDGSVLCSGGNRVGGARCACQEGIH